MRRSQVITENERLRREKESEDLRSLCKRKFGFSYVVFRQNPVSLVGLVLVVIMLLVATVGPFLAPYDPDKTNARVRMQGPSASHFFGTDTYGRDVFSRVLAAARIDFLVAAASIGFAFILGSGIGVVAGIREGSSTTY